MTSMSSGKQAAGGLGPDDAGAILNAVARPFFVIDGDNRIAYVNIAAEQFFDSSMAALAGRPLEEILPADSPVFALIQQVRQAGHSMSEHEVVLETPKIGTHIVSVEASGLSEAAGSIVISLGERSIARKIDEQLTQRSAARSVTAMAAMLAHEVKNPLSGIRGAAQLLEQSAPAEDRELTRLICDETDRIVGLVDRMDMFTDQRPLSRSSINIHEVLGHVHQLAKSGVARHVRFIERYDPSLPPVYGNRDLMIQALFNLVKNAAEAVSPDTGEIILATRFRQGVRLAIAGHGSRIDLPLEVSVQDNGPGIPQDLHAHLYDPFVSTKADGKGLGLALVAKIVADHGGVIEFDSEPRHTQFRLMLPIAPAGEETQR